MMRATKASKVSAGGPISTSLTSSSDRPYRTGDHGAAGLPKTQSKRCFRKAQRIIVKTTGKR